MSASTKSKCLVIAILALLTSGFAYYTGGHIEADAYDRKNTFEDRVLASQASTYRELYRDIRRFSSETGRQTVDDDLFRAKVLKTLGGGVLAGSVIALIGIVFLKFKDQFESAGTDWDF